MTRTGALLWKEWRDHRIALAVFAALVPLVSWPVQRWVFRFAEPEWTWQVIVPLCMGLAAAVVAADVFAMDLATSRMASFTAVPVPVSRHFTVRTAFLAAVAIAFAAWTVATNAAIVGAWGKPGAAATLVGSFEPAFKGVAMSAAAVAGVLVLSALGVGGFRAVLGGLLLAGIGFAAMWYAASLAFRLRMQWEPYPAREPTIWLCVAAVLLVAAYAGFVGGRAHAAGRGRGAWFVAALLVGVFGFPSGAAAWQAYRMWAIVPTDPELILQQPCCVSSDGRYVAVWGQKPQGASRSWIVRVEDGALFDWPGRREGVAGWTTDGLAWVGRMDSRPGGDDFGRLARPETGETVQRADARTLSERAANGWSAGPRWARWLRWDWTPARPASKGVPPTYTSRLWVKDGVEERTVENRGVAPLPRVGEVLIVTPEGKLALVRLAGGEPTIVADDATGLGWSTSGSPDGRYFLVGTSNGYLVLDSEGWKQVAGPWKDTYVHWCAGDAAPATLTLADRKNPKGEMLTCLVEVSTGREIVPDAKLDVLGGYASVQRLPDGGFVARAGTNRLLHLDPDGKFIRRLFPPEE